MRRSYPGRSTMAAAAMLLGLTVVAGCSGRSGTPTAPSATVAGTEPRTSEQAPSATPRFEATPQAQAGALPDLTIREVSYAWELLWDCVSSDTAALFFHVVVRNLGSGDSPPFAVTVADMLVGYSAKGLEAGASDTLVISPPSIDVQMEILALPELMVSVDLQDEVQETDEENNDTALVAQMLEGVSFCRPELIDEAEWFPIALLPSSQPVSLVGIEMFDARTGWGIAGEEGQNHHILRTQDGGRTWIDVSPPELASQVEGLGKPAGGFFLDRNTAWVSYDDRQFDRRLPGSIQLWRTVDGGRTWRYSAIVHRSPYFLDSDFESAPLFHFVDGQYGWTRVYTIWEPRCADWELFRTVDGGETWDYLEQDPFFCPDSGTDFLGRDHIWRTEGSTRDIVPDLVLSQSHDGGLSWQTSSLALPDGDAAFWQCRVHSPNLQTPSSGTVELSCTSYDREKQVSVAHLFSYQTRDGGQTWQVTPLEHSDPTYVSPGQAWVLEPSSGEPAEAPQHWDLLWTDDGGRTWSVVATLDWEGEIDFVSRQVGWALAGRSGEASRLLTTVDGGRSWKEIQPVIGEGSVVPLRSAPPRVSLPPDLQPIDQDTVHRLELLQAVPAAAVSTLAFVSPQAVMAAGHPDGSVSFWLLDGRSYPRRSRLHADWVYAVAGSAEEWEFATASKDGSFRVWDLRGVAAAASRVAFGGEVSSVSVAADGRLATGSQDGLVRLWDPFGNRPQGEAELLLEIPGHAAWVWEVAFTPDGRTLASGSSDRTVRIWDAESGREAAEPLQHGATVRSLAFSPDGRRLATASWDGSVSLWDTASWNLVRQSEEHSSRVDIVRFAPDAPLLVSGAVNGSLSFWSAQDGEPLRILPAGEAAVRSLAFSPDGSLLVTSSADGVLRFWGARP